MVLKATPNTPQGIIITDTIFALEVAGNHYNGTKIGPDESGFPDPLYIPGAAIPHPPHSCKTLMNGV
jgi:hypothetical protein